MIILQSNYMYVLSFGGVPRCIRADAGTENVILGDIQKAFRWEHIDDMAADNSFLVGSSHSNQVHVSL